MDLSLLSLSDLNRRNAPAQPLPPSEYPLNLMLVRTDARSGRQLTGIAAGSLFVHLIAFLVALQLPSFVRRSEPERLIVEHRTPLYFPQELTQKAKNRNKVSKDIDLASLRLSQQEQHQQQASPSPSVRHFEPPRNPGAPEVTSPAPRIMPEAPKIALSQMPVEANAGSFDGVQAAPPPPQANPSPLQTAGTQSPNQQPKIAQPKPPPPGSPATFTDDSQSVPAPALPGITGQSGAQHAAIELQSDPQGADFKPYLEQILAIVRANWQRVTPQAVRSGRLHGRSVIDFIINRDGSIARVIVAAPSGLNQLDVAASTSLVMSSPLPRLPAEFKGYQVRLAFTFAYNMPVR